MDEWLFIQAISTMIPSGFVQASAKFWDITSGVFDAIASYLNNALKPNLLGGQYACVYNIHCLFFHRHCGIINAGISAPAWLSISYDFGEG